jgi:hypothetical protein
MNHHCRNVCDVREIATRRRNHAPPPWAVWERLVDVRGGGHPWLDLVASEAYPSILEARRPSLVVWTSLWPGHPDALIWFDISPT